jgi:hypothetical protein
LCASANVAGVQRNGNVIPLPTLYEPLEGWDLKGKVSSEFCEDVQQQNTVLLISQDVTEKYFGLAVSFPCLIALALSTFVRCTWLEGSSSQKIFPQ